MAYLTYAYILAVYLVANSVQSSFQPCPGLPQPSSVVISGCSSLPCNFKRGTDVEARISFGVKENTQSLKPDVEVEVGKLITKYPLPQQNACMDLENSRCPLEKGENVVYKLKMPIERIYPKVSLTIQLSLVDERSQSQACIRIPAKVVD